jgi:hypothetical protein
MAKVNVDSAGVRRDAPCSGAALDFVEEGPLRPGLSVHDHLPAGIDEIRIAAAEALRLVFTVAMVRCGGQLNPERIGAVEIDIVVTERFIGNREVDCALVPLPCRFPFFRATDENLSEFSPR